MPCEDTHSARDTSGLERGLRQRGRGPADTLIHTAGFQNCEKHFLLFKPPSLWCFVIYGSQGEINTVTFGKLISLCLRFIVFFKEKISNGLYLKTVQSVVGCIPEHGIQEYRGPTVLSFTRH